MLFTRKRTSLYSFPYLLDRVGGTAYRAIWKAHCVLGRLHRQLRGAQTDALGVKLLAAHQPVPPARQLGWGNGSF